MSNAKRLIVLPAVLFVVVSATVFTLAKLHLAKPGLARSSSIRLGDSYRGETVFSTTCAGCHGRGGEGGGVGPKLAGARISLAAAKAQIDNGAGVMPAKLVTGGREEDVLAYLSTIVEPASGSG